MSGLVEVARFLTPMQAELARLFFESRDIDAVVFDTSSFGNLDGAIIGVRLMVLDEDLDDAREALREYEA